jgi:hypothetical protein
MSALGIGGAAAVLWGTPRANAGTGRDGRQFADAVVAAFAKHRLVAIGEVHGQQEHHDAMQILLTDPRLPDLVDDIVVEFGNALYQSTMDRFVTGPAVENDELRRVWRNTTQSPAVSLDAPCYEQFFRTVRAVNWPLPAQRRIRVLLGDPPIDWSKVRTREEVEAFDRDGHLASVVRREVLAKGRRALIFYGSNHVKHAPPHAQGGNGVAQLEQQTGQRVYVILAGGHPRLASATPRTVIPAAGTWLATADSGEFGYLPGDCGVPFGAIADALLYLGPIDRQTQSLWNPASYLDPVFWAELQRRNELMGGHIDLDRQYRRKESVVWPVATYPTCGTS